MRMKRERLRALDWSPSSLARLVPYSCWACVLERVLGPVIGCPPEGSGFPPGVGLGFPPYGFAFLFFSGSPPRPTFAFATLAVAIALGLALATVLVGVALATALATGILGLKFRRGR